MASVAPADVTLRPAASSSFSATPPTDERSIIDNEEEQAALQAVAELLEIVSGAGLAAVASTYHVGSQHRWRHALTVLSRSAPLNGLIADALLERVNAAFTEDLAAFQCVLQPHADDKQGPETAVVVAALESLCASYDRVFPVVRDWCAALRVPGLAACFSVQVRCTLLQGDLMSGDEPSQRRALFAFLRRYGRALLSRDEVDGDENDSNTAALSAGPSREDAVFRCLHRLTLSQSREVKQLWRSVLEARIRDKLRNLSDDFSTHFLDEQVRWLRRCVIPFVAMVLDAAGDDGAGEEGAADSVADRAEQAVWCAEMRHRLLRSYARRRLASFWEILSDYPDSIPALEDLHYCLQANAEGGLKAELVRTVRHLLASRLHRAGTRTEDILAILINTINAFCVLFARNEQNSVLFAVIADTLDHLRQRKDCVTAIVQAVMQPSGPMNAPPPPPPAAQRTSQTAAALSLMHDEEEGEQLDQPDLLYDGVSGGPDAGDLHRGSSSSDTRGRPDVLRVLLTSIHRRALVEEYQQVLAEQLLQKPMHVFDTTPEEEVLERLKQVFGESVLDRCAVMVRDMQMSRRMTQQLREQMGLRRGGGDAGAAQPASVSVLSMTTWPALARCAAVPASDVSGRTHVGAGPLIAPLKHRPHPVLQSEMEALAAAYNRLRANQRLAWLPSLGRVELELTQRDPAKGNAPVTTSHVFSLFEASVVLYVKEMGNGRDGGAVAVDQLATALDIPVEELRPHVHALSPSVLVLPTSETVAVQLSVVSSSDFVFAEETKEDGASVKPAGLAPERVKLMERMITSLLKTRGPQAATAIHSSLKLLAKFEGTATDLLELLQSFIQRGLIVLNESKLYALLTK